MIEPAQFALFIGVSWALIITPGPDMIYVITRGISHGRKAGIVSAFGVICGILIHTMAAALGMALIFQTSVIAFRIVKYIGALYLIYLGVKSWLGKSSFNLQPSTLRVSSQALFWQGMLSNVLNPKIAIFFLSFLPQFIDKGSSNISLQMVMLGFTFALFGLCFLTFVGYFAGSIGAWLSRKQQYTKTFRWITGSILISLGSHLALAEQ